MEIRERVAISGRVHFGVDRVEDFLETFRRKLHLHEPCPRTRPRPLTFNGQSAGARVQFVCQTFCDARCVQLVLMPWRIRVGSQLLEHFFELIFVGSSLSYTSEWVSVLWLQTHRDLECVWSLAVASLQRYYRQLCIVVHFCSIVIITRVVTNPSAPQRASKVNQPNNSGVIKPWKWGNLHKHKHLQKGMELKTFYIFYTLKQLRNSVLSLWMRKNKLFRLFQYEIMDHVEF